MWRGLRSSVRMGLARGNGGTIVTGQVSKRSVPSASAIRSSSARTVSCSTGKFITFLSVSFFVQHVLNVLEQPHLPAVTVQCLRQRHAEAR